MDRVFLDANVLFSAAYRSDAGLRRLWRVRDCVLLSSAYAADEARRNLREQRQRSDLDDLLGSVQIVESLPSDSTTVEEADLPAKDRPILRAAVAAGATHLITGDVTHFGRYFGRRIAGVLIQLPADYLANR